MTDKDVKFFEGIKSQKYEVASLVRTDDNLWGAYYWGKHVEQGGMVFTKGNVFCEELQTVMKLVEKGLSESAEDIDSLIKDKSKWKGPKDSRQDAEE